MIKNAANVAKAVAIVLQHEGGYCVDDGGPTNFGWTLPALAEIGITMTADELQAQTPEWAAALYTEWYWNGFGDVEDQTIATKLLDIAVNSEEPAHVAHGRAVMMAQQALNAIGAKVTIDGVGGPKTCAAINNCTPALLLTAIISVQARFYRFLAAQDPVKYGPSLTGWLKRAAWPGAVV